MRKILFLFILIIVCLSSCESDKQKTTLIFGDEKPKNEFVEIYQYNDGTKVYSEYANIKFKKSKNEIIQLEKALEQKLITIDDIISKMEFTEELNDGGSKVYSYDTEYNDLADINFVIIKCNSIDGNKNILIGSNKYIYDKQ